MVEQVFGDFIKPAVSIVHWGGAGFYIFGFHNPPGFSEDSIGEQPGLEAYQPSRFAFLIELVES